MGLRRFGNPRLTRVFQASKCSQATKSSTAPDISLVFIPGALIGAALKWSSGPHGMSVCASQNVPANIAAIPALLRLLRLLPRT